MSKIEFLTQIIIKMKEKNYPSNFCVFVNHNAFYINCAIGRKTTCHCGGLVPRGHLWQVDCFTLTGFAMTSRVWQVYK